MKILWQKVLEFFGKKSAEKEADEANTAQEQVTHSPSYQIEEDREEAKTHSQSSEIDTNEIDHLKRKIKKLEEENEDLEDEVDDLERKLSKLKRESVSTDELESEQKKVRSLEASLSEEKEARENLLRQQQEKEELIAEKNLALNIIQKLFLGEERVDSNYKRRIEQIAQLDSFVKNDYFPATEACKFYDENTCKSSKDDILNFLKEWSAQYSKVWLVNRRKIAFIGEFSAGKTSIVNRILSQDNPNIPLLPVSAKATTAIATYITREEKSTKPSYSYITQDGKRKEIEDKVFNSISKEVLEHLSGMSSLIKYFVLTYNNPNLDGLSILDTPGFNSKDSEDKERTMEVVNECDALFWVVDVNAGTVNQSSIKIIQQELRKPLYVVINKTVSKSDNQIRKVEQLIRETLERAGIQIEQIIRFSQKAPLQDIMNPILNVQSRRENEDFPESIKSDLKLSIQRIQADLNRSYENMRSNKKLLNNVESAITGSVRRTIDNLERAKGRAKEHEGGWFTSKHYRMSVDDYNNLMKDLTKCEGETEQLREYSQNIKMTSKRVFVSQNELNDVSQKLKLLESCLDKLEHIFPKTQHNGTKSI